MKKAVFRISLVTVACAPTGDPTPDQPSFAEPEDGLPGRLAGGFYPTWEVGSVWTVVDDLVDRERTLPRFGPTPFIPMIRRVTYGMEVESVDERGTARLNFWYRPEAPLGPEAYDYLEIDRSGVITLVDSRRGGAGLDPPQGDGPYGHPEHPDSSIRVARVWPLFPLEPGLRQSPDGAWTQAVRVDGDARIVTIAFRDGIGRGELGEECPAVVIQRWEPRQPIWSSRVGAGCNGAWSLGKLLGRDDDEQSFAVLPERTTDP